MTRKELEAGVKKARKRVAAMDAIDGFEERDPLTIKSALEAGLLDPASGAQFDALVMLETVKTVKLPRGHVCRAN